MSGNQSEQQALLLAVADKRLGPALGYILEKAGISVAIATDQVSLQARLRAEPPDLLICDVGLPDLDAVGFCTALRLDKRTRDLPCILLGIGPEAAERDRLLQAGADGYVAPGFAPEDLLGLVRSCLDTEPARAEKPPDSLGFADLRLEPGSFRVARNGRPIHLALTEFRLLQHLMLRPRRVHSRGELQTALWPPGVRIGPRTIDVHIGRLRCALRQDGAPDLIRTVRSVGYSLSD